MSNVIRVYNYMIEYQLKDEWSSTIDIITARTKQEALQRLEMKLNKPGIVLHIRQINPRSMTMNAYYASQFEEDYF